jgi:hypothetical protein
MAAVHATLTSKDFLGRDIVAAWIQTASPTASVTLTDSGDVATLNSHGLANGSVVVLQTLTTTTGVAINVRYYVVGATTNTFQLAATYGGSALTLTSDGSATIKAIREVEVFYTNNVTSETTEKTITFEGSGQTRDYKTATGFGLTIAPDSVALIAIESAFAKTVTTSNLPGAATGGLGMMSSADGQGVTAGILVQMASTGRTFAGVESEDDLFLWAANGTLTMSGPPNAQTSDKATGMQFNFSASRATADVAGGALPTEFQNKFYNFYWV